MDAKSDAKAISDLVDGQVVATVEIAAPMERAFEAISSREIAGWWVNPGVFDTREWSGDVRVGGHWRAIGMSRGMPYVLEGKFLEVDPPRKLVHTWQGVAPGAPSRVTYLLDPIEGGTRLTVKHSDITTPWEGANIHVGWRTSLDRLAEILSSPS
jgi:uncharacterized protein YndB with AHSA1/START domain